jgi:hypothetical protein
MRAVFLMSLFLITGCKREAVAPAFDYVQCVAEHVCAHEEPLRVIAACGGDLATLLDTLLATKSPVCGGQ